MQKLFGDELRQARKKQGLTIQAIADICGTSRSYITLIEIGKRQPGKKLIPKIATALNLKTAEVVNWYIEDLRQQFQ